MYYLKKPSIKNGKGGHDALPKSMPKAIKGIAGENAAYRTIMGRLKDYEQMPTKVGSNNGIDAVFVKYNTDQTIIKDIIICESKYSFDARLKLAKTRHMGKQMSLEWLSKNVRKMIESGDPEVSHTGRFLEDLYRRDPTRLLSRIKINVLDANGCNRWLSSQKHIKKLLEQEARQRKDSPVTQNPQLNASLGVIPTTTSTQLLKKT